MSISVCAPAGPVCLCGRFSVRCGGGIYLSRAIYADGMCDGEGRGCICMGAT